MLSEKKGFPKFPKYKPTDDDAYLDFTMKVLEWQDKVAEKLQKRLENAEKQMKSWRKGGE